MTRVTGRAGVRGGPKVGSRDRDVLSVAIAVSGRRPGRGADGDPRPASTSTEDGFAVDPEALPMDEVWVGTRCAGSPRIRLMAMIRW